MVIAAATMMEATTLMARAAMMVMTTMMAKSWHYPKLCDYGCSGEFSPESGLLFSVVAAVKA